MSYTSRRVRYRISLPDSTIVERGLIFEDEIGKGAYGIVYKAILDGYGHVAVKVIDISKKTAKKCRMLYSECDIATTPNLSHSALLKRMIYHPENRELLSNETIREKTHNSQIDISSESDDCDFMDVIQIYDLIDGLSLKYDLEIVHIPGSSNSYDQDVITHYIKCMLEGLDQLAEAHVAHRDIKPANIMIQRGDVKFIDFGIACKYEKCISEMAGTPTFMAPELFEDSHVNFEAGDVYALGLTILLFFVDIKVIRRGDNIENLIEENVSDKRIRKLLLGMTDKSAKLRFTARQALEMFR